MLVFSDKNGTTWDCYSTDQNIFVLRPIVGNYEESITLTISEKDYNKLCDFAVALNLNFIDTKDKLTEFIEELKKRSSESLVYGWEDYEE